jgi:hypothetical protein
MSIRIIMKRRRSRAIVRRKCRKAAALPQELVRALLARLREGHDARHRKIRRLRAAIKVGCYENNLKLQVALDRMLREMGM